MTEIVQPGGRSDFAARHFSKPIELDSRRIRRRYFRQAALKWAGIGAILIGIGVLAILVFSIVTKGYTAFVATEIRISVDYSVEKLDPKGTGDMAEILDKGNFRGLALESIRARFPEVEGRQARRALGGLISSAGAAEDVRGYLADHPEALGRTVDVWVLASSELDVFNKDQERIRALAEDARRVSDAQIGWFDALDGDGAVRTVVNARFLSNGDSREPELAGIWGATVGSIFTLLVTLALAFPIGVTAAIYLEEYAPTNRWTDLIEVNINNLAAVPSIVFGLLGLAVFLNFFGLPRSAPLVGGMTLALMTLPTIIIAARAALKAVPPSIREAARGVGASELQVTTHHVLPLAMPGILTGTIIGMAQALGETAPLLMIGMIAFIVSIPAGPTDPSTVLPVQIFLWYDAPERGFVEKASAAIMVLLLFLILMNALAVILRKRFERRW
jgi:phosphate transport system permease protein